jgi:hypothetical protein
MQMTNQAFPSPDAAILAKINLDPVDVNKHFYKTERPAFRNGKVALISKILSIKLLGCSNEAPNRVTWVFV